MSFWPFALRSSLGGALLPLFIGCDVATECTAGTERCACYGNGTCEEGLVCLSEHCVDPTPDGDAASQTAVTGRSPSDGGASTVVDPDTEVDTETEPSPFDTSAPPLTSAAAPFPDSSWQEAETSIAPGLSTNREPSTNPGPASNPADATSTGAVSEPTSSAEPHLDTTTDDTTATPTPVIPELPSRATTALDDPASPVAASSGCPLNPLPLDLQGVCYEEVPCTDEPCSAQLEWVLARANFGQLDYSFTLRGLSGDGTVLLGDWVATGNADRRATLLRWGHDRATVFDADTSATAINADATAAIGAREATVDTWEFLRWRRGVAEVLPQDWGTPNDISDGTTIVGYNRIESVLRGFSWTSGEPSYATTIALQAVSGDGASASGVIDNGGPVVLFHANGTTTIPPTPNFRPDATSDVNADGSVVVGYGWSQSTAKSPMFRWRVVDEAVDVIAPLGDFESAYASGVTDDGEVIVGTNLTGASNGPIEDSEAFYWDIQGGMRPLVEELGARGLEVPLGLWLSNARISRDGTTVAGEGYDGNSRILWRARLAR